MAAGYPLANTGSGGMIGGNYGGPVEAPNETVITRTQLLANNVGELGELLKQLRGRIAAICKPDAPTPVDPIQNSQQQRHQSLVSDNIDDIARTVRQLCDEVRAMHRVIDL